MKIRTDVLFLIDSSQGVSPQDYQLQKNFVKRLAYHLKLSTDGPRGALSAYATYPYTVVNFGEQDFEEKVDNATLMKRPRRLDRALEHASDMFANSGGSDGKILILITAGKETRFPDLKSLNEASKPLRKQGVQTYVIALGQDHNTNIYTSVVVQPQDIIQVPVIGHLLSRTSDISRQIRDGSCKLRQFFPS